MNMYVYESWDVYHLSDVVVVFQSGVAKNADDPLSEIHTGTSTFSTFSQKEKDVIYFFLTSNFFMTLLT